MKLKKIITAILISLLLEINFAFIIDSIAIAAAGEVAEEIDYSFNSGVEDYEVSGYLYSAKSSLETTPIIVPSKPGKIIKKLEWVDKESKRVIRSVNGFISGRMKYEGIDGLKDTLQGAKLKVTSNENSNFGGVYYWDRWSIYDPANWDGKHWRAGAGRVSVADSRGCDASVPKENIQGHHLPRYPGCTDPYLEADIPRSKPFMINEPTDPLNQTWIKTGAISKELKDVTASNVVVDDSTSIMDVHGIGGTSDPSTVGGEVARLTDLDSITIYFKQTFNNDTYNKYWANPGAKQVWYFSKFFVDFNSVTYRYKDKLLIATYADGTSGLEITGNKCVAPGGTTQLVAKLTKVDGTTWELKNHAKLTWTSSNTSVMTINTSGLVTAVASTGTSTITARFADSTQALDEKADFSMTVGTGNSCTDDNSGGNPGGGTGQCKYTIAAPSSGSTVTGNKMNPDVTGMIKADNRGNEIFDVLRGIPTSENLYANVFANQYLFQHTFAKMSGKVNYQCQVQVTYALEWKQKQPDVCTTNKQGQRVCTPQPDLTMKDTESKTYSFSFQRDYSYWQINNIEVYGIQRASMNNYALPNGTVTLQPSGYSAPSLSTDHNSDASAHVKPKDSGTISFTPATVTGMYTRPSVPNDESQLKSRAESQTGEPEVRNDQVAFNGTTIMSNSWTTKHGTTPGNIPSPTMIGQNVLYRSGMLISDKIVNAANTPSSGTIYYNLVPGNINGGSDKQFSINGINTVTVHTPVVNYSSITDDREHNQKTTPNYNRAALILERPFTVRMPTNGQHVNYPGYGDRDYAKYFRIKQVWFPFDVYTADRSRFIPKRTWTDIPVNQLDTTFFLPVWVDEGDYSVLYRTIAENTPDSFTHQPTANTNWENHVATHEIAVEVIGRVYDFHVTDIMDFNWETVFRKQKGSSEPTGNSFWVGSKGIDGEARGNAFPYELPVRKGSHPDSSYKNVAVKTGYAFKFDLKTKGNMFGSGDGIHLKPTFYFTDSKGQKRQEVDVYYHTDERKFIRIGSAEDKVRRSMELNVRLRNVPEQRILDAAGAFYELFASSMTVSRQAYIEEWARAAKKPTTIGSYSDLFLPYHVRTFMGPISVPTGVSEARAYSSIQQWYGEYNLPAKLYIVPKGFDLSKQFSFNDKAPFFLRDGFLIVNFDIETVRDGQKGKPHLQYIKAPLTNQWKREGSHPQFTDPYGVTFQLKDGDAMFYRADQSSVDDFGVTGTH